MLVRAGNKVLAKTHEPFTNPGQDGRCIMSAARLVKNDSSGVNEESADQMFVLEIGWDRLSRIFITSYS